MAWRGVLEVRLEHDYYAPNPAPVSVQPTNPTGFARAGFLLRQSGASWHVLADDENTDLPTAVTLNVIAQNTEILSVTAGAHWTHVPVITVPLDADAYSLSPEHASDVAQPTARKILAQLDIELEPDAERAVGVTFSAMASHWAYHVIGPDNDDVTIEDTEGDVIFEPVGTVDLPQGVTAHVIRSLQALPAQARPSQRFSLSRPGPFGPRMLIPVLPAPDPQFVKVPAPDGSGAIIQSDIYVSIL